MGRDLGAIEEHGRAGHDALEVDEHPGGRRSGDVLAVDPHLLPGGVVPVTPGERRDRVRKGDGRKPCLRISGRLGAADVRAAEQPVLVERVSARRRGHADRRRRPRGARTMQHASHDRDGPDQPRAQHRAPREPRTSRLRHRQSESNVTIPPAGSRYGNVPPTEPPTLPGQSTPAQRPCAPSPAPRRSPRAARPHGRIVAGRAPIAGFLVHSDARPNRSEPSAAG